MPTRFVSPARRWVPLLAGFVLLGACSSTTALDPTTQTTPTTSDVAATQQVQEADAPEGEDQLPLETGGPAPSAALAPTTAAAPPSASTADQFVTAILLNPPPGFTESDARCTVEQAQAAMSDGALEFITANLIEFDEIEQDEPLADEDLWVLADALADCSDMSAFVDEVATDFDNPALLPCLQADLGEEAVESYILAEIIGENIETRPSRLLIEGMRGGCTELTRELIEQSIVDLGASDEEAERRACLATIDDATLLTAVEAGGIFEWATGLALQC